MAISFSPKLGVITPEKLFGRKELFNQLISLANNRYSVSIIGLRRFGKTSILKCIETSLENALDAKVYPVYFDFKEVGSVVKGTDNVFRYMVAQLVVKLFNDKHFLQEAMFKRVSIVPTSHWEDIFESLIKVNAVRIQGLFEEIIIFFSEYIDKTILFLIDEYEWLFRFSFDQPVGFMKLRNLSSKTLSNGVCPFSFWIAGATPWDHLCTITGSGELNVIDAPPIYLGPIDYQSFKSMWLNELDTSKNYTEQLQNSTEFAYNASGGIPFYGKLIGSHLASENNKPSFTLLKSYFKELIESLSNEEKTILFDLAKSSRNYKSSNYIFELLHKGLIKKNGSNYEISIGFFKEFLNSSYSHINNSKNDTVPESQKLTDIITSLIMNINNTHKNKRGSYIFEPVVDEAALIKDLRTPCYSLEIYSDFASSLYKILFERTKGNRNGVDHTKERLPNNFKNQNQFLEIVDIMRHSLGGGHLMDTFSQRQGQLSKSRMLEILIGTRNEPNSAEEFYNLQISTLKMFEFELNKLNNMIRALI